MYLKLIVTFITILFACSIQASAQDIVSDFDLVSYNPLRAGVKDIYCEIRIEGLTEQLKKQYVTLKINDEVYYKVYWVQPSKFDIVVEGLPRGFEKLKDKLKLLVVNRLDFIIPQDLSVKLKGYSLKKKAGHQGQYFEGIDPTNKMPVNKIEVGFNSKGVLAKYKSYSPLGFQSSDFSYGKKSWSKNKWVLEKIEAKAIQGPQITESETEISYEKFAGIGMPVQIDIDTIQRVSAPGKSEKKISRQGETVLNFSNYKINMNKAGEYFRGKE